jgi:hypothetical protein
MPASPSSRSTWPKANEPIPIRIHRRNTPLRIATFPWGRLSMEFSLLIVLEKLNFDFQNEYFEPSEGVGQEKVVCREFRKTIAFSNRVLIGQGT